MSEAAEAPAERKRVWKTPPGVALCAEGDIADPEPMRDADGRPYAETHFQWLDPSDQYWHNRRLALHARVSRTESPGWPGAGRQSSGHSAT